MSNETNIAPRNEDLNVAINEKENIKNLIYTIRGKQIILDSDIAKLYEVETKKLNQAVKRNKERFPEEFCFQLTKKEYNSLRSQFVTSKGGRRYLPYVFTEQGVAMLSSVLHSNKAIKVSINIINAFIEMRKFIVNNELMFEKISSIELKQLEYPTLKVSKTNKFHDRFIVIDNMEIYHCGASLKDLGKKCFAINKMEGMDIIEKIISMTL